MRATSIVIAATFAASLSAMEPASVELMGGLSYLTHDDSRELVDDGSSSLTNEYGYYACFGFSAPQTALVGYPWLEFPMTRHSGNDSRIDSVGVLYTERAPLTELFYLGLGIGSFYNDYRITSDGGNIDRDDKWTIGGKALVGIGPAGKGFFGEVSYQYSGKIGGTESNSINGALGIRF